MNRTSSRLFSIASLIIGGAIVLGGCGPQDLNDPDYLAQMDDAGINSAEKPAMDDKGAEAPMAGQQQPMDQNAPQGQAQQAGPDGGAGGAPVAGGPVGPVGPACVGGGCPLVELPPQFIREPDLVTPLPPTQVNTFEQRNFRQLIDHYREILVPQDNVRVHNINSTLGVHHRFRQRIINIPTSRTVITTTGNTVLTQEALPDEVVTLPLVDYGPPIIPCAPLPVIAPVPYFGGPGFCPTPFFGRGAYFGCSRPLF